MAIRQALGLSQTELAAELGVCLATVNRWETGAVDVDRRTVMACRYLLMAPDIPAQVARV